MWNGALRVSGRNRNFEPWSNLVGGEASSRSSLLKFPRKQQPIAKRPIPLSPMARKRQEAEERKLSGIHPGRDYSLCGEIDRKGEFLYLYVARIELSMN